MKRLAVGVLTILAACGPRVPLLLAPDRVESFCSEKEPRGTAVASILSSATDVPSDRPYPREAALRADVKKKGGVIGHWASQPLHLPATAARLGVSGDYLDVTDVVINNQLEAADSRLIYLTVATPAGPKHLVLRAYDIQNVCVEGTRLS